MSCNPHLVLCHRQHLCCLAAEPIGRSNTAAAAAAGTGLAGSSAAELLSDVDPGPPSSGLVPAFSNREKLNYPRLLLLASQELHLFVPQWYVLCKGKKEAGGGFTLKLAGVVLWEGLLALFDNPFSYFLGCWMRKGRSGSSYSFSGMFFFPGIILEYKMKQEPSDSINTYSWSKCAI